MPTLAGYSGPGVVKLINGDLFEGHFDEGWREGHGILNFGTINRKKLELQSVEGTYSHDVLEGVCRVTYASGDLLICDFLHGVPNGPAKLFDGKGQIKQVRNNCTNQF